MNIQINGQDQTVTAAIDIATLLLQLGHDLTGVAVAINQVIIPQTDWQITPLQEGDQLSLFRAIAGG